MDSEFMKDMAKFLRYCSQADGLGMKIGAEGYCKAIAEAARAFLAATEINGIGIGDFKVDLFINDLGNLGISIQNSQAPEKIRDIFVSPTLTEIHVG